MVKNSKLYIFELSLRHLLMEVKIVGAGPAGLYFALLGRKLNPNYNFILYERGHRVEVTGLGYTLVESLRETISNIGEDITTRVFSQATRPWMISETECKGKKYDGKSTYKLYGIRRSDLINTLREVAIRRGIKINYEQRIDEEQVEQLRRECDLLVGADGVNSVVRKASPRDFGEYAFIGTTAYIWLSNRDSLKHMKTVVRDYNGHPFIGIFYPISNKDNCLIVECKYSSLEALGLGRMVNNDQTISEEGIRFLHNLFTEGGSKFRITSSNSRWRKPSYVRCVKLFHENTALIGEAAQTLRYNTGSGIRLAFKTAEELALNIKEKELSLEQSLSRYNLSVSQSLNTDWLASESFRKGVERIILENYARLEARFIGEILGGIKIIP